MQIEIVEMEDTRAKFILKNSSPAMANALRRTMLQDIPKMVPSCRTTKSTRA